MRGHRVAPGASAGADAADVNGDGRADLAVGGGTNALFLNAGAETFLDLAELAGLDAVRGTRAVKWADLDGDGRVDLFLTHGEGDAALRGLGDYRFENAGRRGASATWRRPAAPPSRTSIGTGTSTSW